MRILILFLLMTSVVLGKDKSKKKSVLTETQQLMEVGYFMDAAKAKILEDYATALKMYEKVLEINPKNDAALYELANLYLASNQKAKAELAIEEAVKIDEKNKWYRDKQGEIYAANEKFDKASKIYELKVKEDPRNPELYYEWSYMLSNNGKLKEAIAALNKVEEYMGINEEVVFQKQKLYLKLNDVKGAVAEMQKLIKENPEETRYKLILAEIYNSNEMKSAAKIEYESIVKKDPYNPYASMALAQMYKKEGDMNKYKEMVQNFVKNPKGEIDPKIAFLYTHIQRFEKLDKSDKEMYLSMARDVAETHPKEAKAHALLGDFYYLSDSNKLAAVSYKKSIGLKTDVFTVWQQLFSILLEQKNYAELRDSSTKAIELYPTQVMTYYYNGMANYYLKDYTAAEKRFKKTLQISGDNAMLKAQVQSLIGDMYYEQKKYDESDKAYEAAIELDNRNAYAMNNFAYHLSTRSTNLEKAATMSKRSLELQPNSSSFLDTYAWILFKQGKYKEAKEYQDKAISSSEDDRTTLFEHYGDILYQLGEIDNALTYWKKSVSAGNNSEILKRKVAEKKYISEDVQ
jgi:tetratricopeptide (TPR) repeat protein